MGYALLLPRRDRTLIPASDTPMATRQTVSMVVSAPVEGLLSEVRTGVSEVGSSSAGMVSSAALEVAALEVASLEVASLLEAASLEEEESLLEEVSSAAKTAIWMPIISIKASAAATILFRLFFIICQPFLFGSVCRKPVLWINIYHSPIMCCGNESYVNVV